jgi:hypothetical protein
VVVIHLKEMELLVKEEREVNQVIQVNTVEEEEGADILVEVEEMLEIGIVMVEEVEAQVIVRRVMELYAFKPK